MLSAALSASCDLEAPTSVCSSPVSSTTACIVSARMCGTRARALAVMTEKKMPLYTCGQTV